MWRRLGMPCPSVWNVLMPERNKQQINTREPKLCMFGTIWYCTMMMGEDKPFQVALLDII